MIERLRRVFYRAVIGHPWGVLVAVVAVLGVAAYQARHFELDASAESLLVQDSPALETFRDVNATYGSQPFLFVTYTPQKPLFSEQSLATLDSLAGDLAVVDGVASVTHMLNVPMIETTDVGFGELAEDVPTLGEGDVTPAQARRELVNSPLYQDLIINDDADTTAILVRLAADTEHQSLLEKRQKLRDQKRAGELDPAGRAELAQVQRDIEAHDDRAQQRLEDNVAAIRDVLGDYRDRATIHLGGVPMIAVDMIDFVDSDIRTFGVAVGLFIVVLLAAAFGRPRWVVAPALICAAVVLAVFGLIGTMGWPVTVVSSNFVSLVLIITLSLIVHLIVRYRELRAADPDADQGQLLRRTIDSKLIPSVFTALTTAISFAALLFADIQPVKDFGRIMTCAVVLAFVAAFVLFPAMLAWLRPTPVPRLRGAGARRVNVGIAHLVQRRPGITATVFLLLAAVGVTGALQLSVENRFIDYFHEDTEIYQGMRLIDRELGGTTPLSVIIDAPSRSSRTTRRTRHSPRSSVWGRARARIRPTATGTTRPSSTASAISTTISTAWRRPARCFRWRRSGDWRSRSTTARRSSPTSSVCSTSGCPTICARSSSTRTCGPTAIRSASISASSIHCPGSTATRSSSVSAASCLSASR
jgi:predicted RND superfamily exporter protein